VAALFGAPNDGCVIGLAELFAIVSLNTLPGVGGTAAGEPTEPTLNANEEAPFPGSGFVVSDPALKEKRGFVVGKLAAANDGGLACAPPPGAPNRSMEFPVAPFDDCP
jgi:hypothetical protein